MRVDTVVEIEGCNGEWFTIAGPNAGDKGVWLGTGVSGLYDPPVKVVDEVPGNWPGSRYLNHRVQKRDVVFGVEILHEECDTWMSRESEWRKAWSFDKDTVMHVTTSESGTRRLKLRLAESPEVDWETDPTLKTVNRTQMVCFAYNPWWWQDDEVHIAACKTDTTFDPNALNLPWPWPKKKLPTETITITVPMVNPTDQAVYPKWSVPGSTVAPAEPYVPGLPWLGAPKSHATIWTIPDYSWQNDDKAQRRVTLPALVGGLRTNEVQTVVVDGRPTGGTWTLTLGSETTAPLPYNATPQQVTTALTALAHIAAGDVKVQRSAQVNEVQTIELHGGPTGGTFTLSCEGQTTSPLPYNAAPLAVELALKGLPLVGFADVRVAQDYFTNCEQVITIAGEPTAGTFTLTFDGQTTRPIRWNATNLEVAAALTKLPNIDTFDVIVTGSPPFLGGAPWNVRFQGGLAGVNVTDLIGDATNLSGGAGITVKVRKTKAGGKRYRATFQGALSGDNVGTITADTSQLTGGKDVKAEIITVEQGVWPYRIEFDKNLSGKPQEMFTGNASGLTGAAPGTTPEILVDRLQAGKTFPAENAFVDADPRVEQVISESGSQLWARMNGVRLIHAIPPYTGNATFTVTVSGCQPGQTVALRLPRPWSRPWGLH